MKINTRIFMLLFAFTVLQNHAHAWGFWAHRTINNKAVHTLPAEMKGFYSYYSQYITDHAIDPDKKRYCDMNEGPHHFIDLDHYCQCPCDSLPRHWKDAVKKYTEDTLNKYGTVPWYINLEYMRLVQAFKDKNPDLILKLSGDIGHYIADSYVPLHACSNYDGQFSSQWGIHAFWESSIPELMGNEYHYNVGKAVYIQNISDYAWYGSLEASLAVDSVLVLEQELEKVYPKDSMYCFDQNKAGQTILKFSPSFTRAYSEKLNGMVERKMHESIYAVGNFWMSAWVDAGEPDLDALIGKAVLNDQ